MKSREPGTRLFILMVAYGLCIAIITWFMTHVAGIGPVTSLVASCGVSSVLSWFAYRFINHKLRITTDFLKDKLNKVARGDLAQNFEEDPEDILQFGIASGLNSIMKTLRENVTTLKKTSSSLLRQLHSISISSNEIAQQIHKSNERLIQNKQCLEDLKSTANELTQEISKMRIVASKGALFVGQMFDSSGNIADELEMGKSRLEQLVRQIQRICKTTGDLDQLKENVNIITGKAGFIKKAIAELLTETSLVNINAAIDASRSEGADKNFKKLIEEMHLVTEKLSMLSQESGHTFIGAQEKLDSLTSDIRKCHLELLTNQENALKPYELLCTLIENSGITRSKLDTLSSSAIQFKERLEWLNERVNTLSETIRSSDDEIGLLSSGTDLMLSRLGELGVKIGSMQDTIESLKILGDVFETH